jgi:tRNA(Ile2) C34 agmatinyltransferase TiaS
MNRRLSNLKETGGFIHENLKRSVLEKLGHSERAEYFCYKCGDAAKEIGDEVFKCSACNVTYETKKFNLPRIHKNLRKNQTDGPWNIPPEEDGDDISFF